MLRNHILSIVTCVIFLGLAVAKDGQRYQPKTQPQQSIAPLNSRWNSDKKTIARYYPAKSITEEQFMNLGLKFFGLFDNNNEIFLKYQRNTISGIHKHYGQVYKGIMVKDAELVINMDLNGKVVSVFNNPLPVQNFSVVPAISLSESEAIAFCNIDGKNLRGKCSGDLVIAEYEGKPVLVYEWLIPAGSPYGDWQILIDAKTGEVIDRKDLRRFVTGNGRVFIPDPKTAIEEDSLQDEGDSNSAIPLECYSEVELLELEEPVGGIYTLSGAYVNTEPTLNRAAETSPDFFYYRQDDRFEEVNVYYHIDTYQRYIQSLGFDDIMHFSISCNVNGTTEDNSWFSSLTWTITYGSGGVDDGEDADVILHEYGHAIHEDIIPGWSGGHTGAMGEGFGDYLAGSYSLTINSAFHPEWVFTWDGHNEFWAGRWLNLPYHYPENANGEIHDSGQLWSAGLMDVWYDVPNIEIWDKIIFQHHYYLGNGATMEDAANAILLADIEINNAEYRWIILENFSARGFLDPSYFVPQIEHSPLHDSEDTLQVEFPILAQITSNQPLDTNSATLYWGIDGIITDTVHVESAGNDTFVAYITGPFNQQTVNYFLSAADTFGGLAFNPPEAPAQMNSFYVGPDTVPPQITLLDTLTNTIFVNGFAEVQALISDNIGISQAELHYCPPGSLYQWMPMERVNGDTFRAVLSWSALNFGSEYYYYISAEDSSSNSNISCSSEFGFQLMTSQLFDDFESGLDKWISEGDWGLQEVRFHSPSHSLRDRVNSGIPSSEQLILTLITPWTPAGLTAFNLEYWTQYFLLPQNDTGYVEIEINGGWDKVDSVIGAIPNWEHRVVNLSEYIDLDSVRIRFRTRADTAFAYPTLGWYVDDIILSSGVVVGCEQDLNEKMRENLEICGISPNPGNQEFSLLFRIPGEGRVQARIYDLTGQLVAKAADSTFPAGNNFLKWNCTSASGIYFLQLEYKGQKKIAKIVVLK